MVHVLYFRTVLYVLYHDCHHYMHFCSSVYVSGRLQAVLTSLLLVSWHSMPNCQLTGQYPQLLVRTKFATLVCMCVCACRVHMCEGVFVCVHVCHVHVCVCAYVFAVCVCRVHVCVSVCLCVCVACVCVCMCQYETLNVHATPWSCAWQCTKGSVLGGRGSGTKSTTSTGPHPFGLRGSCTISVWQWNLTVYSRVRLVVILTSKSDCHTLFSHNNDYLSQSLLTPTEDILHQTNLQHLRSK